ncbi:MAG: AAA family ATPase [Arenicella sp.]|jgi:predicted ATP-dependent endonuclease of OLD family|nr:AAA family ATPase [Arenicella sp.]
MRLVKARVENYRSIIDSGEFSIESLKTILVGPNEAGKTVLLRALQQLNRPEGVDGFDALRDYPRSKYNEITTGQIDIKDVTVVTGFFELEDEDKALIPSEYHNCKYKLYRNLNNKGYHALIDAPEKKEYCDISKSLTRMASHMDKQYAKVPSPRSH